MCLLKSLFHAVVPTLFLCSGGPKQSAQRASPRAVAACCAGKLLLWHAGYRCVMTCGGTGRTG